MGSGVVWGGASGALPWAQPLLCVPKQLTLVVMSAGSAAVGAWRSCILVVRTHGEWLASLTESAWQLGLGVLEGEELHSLLDTRRGKQQCVRYPRCLPKPCLLQPPLRQHISVVRHGGRRAWEVQAAKERLEGADHPQIKKGTDIEGTIH